jgi:hypothetical protein
MFPLSLELKAAGIALALASVCGLTAWAIHHERSVGAAQCRSQQEALVASYQAKEAQARAERQQQAASAAADFEASRARSTAALASTRAALSSALQRPICTPHAASESDHAQTLADLPIPADVVSRLRDSAAGGDSRPH